ncbi:MAG: crosslink repair DNA glycosylase YcaQ family protein [Bacteroidota bacterium]
MEKRKTTKVIQLSLPQAREFVIHQQLLFPSFKAEHKKAVLAIVEHLGYVQIDTISVIERAHHHVIWSRFPKYQNTQLQGLEEKDRLVFEYWAHAAAYLPMRDFRFSLIRKAQIKAGKGHWGKRNPKMMKRVLERFKTDGALMARDFKKEHPKSDLPWAQHPVNQAIRQLYMEGTIMVTARQGFQKIYDLTEHVLPPKVDVSFPDRSAYLLYLIDRDLRANGLMKASEFGHLITNIRSEVVSLLQKLVAAGNCIKVKIQGLEETYYAHKRDLTIFLNQSPPAKHFFILSPFDNFLIQRKRIQTLFNFDYTLECYVTAAKRKIGYFSLPMLWGSQFIGQIDLKADRKTKTLWIKNLVLEERVKDSAALREVFKKSINQFAQFNKMERIEVDSTKTNSLPRFLRLP